MEDNMGQVNTMIGNLRNMAIDMGSELENQNNQVDRINRKVILIRLKLVTQPILHLNKFSIPNKFTNHLYNRVFAFTNQPIGRIK